MLARVVLFSLVLEAALYAALAAWLRAEWNWSLPAVACLALGLLLGSRLALVCLSAWLAWMHRSPCAPEHCIGFGRTMRYLAGEYRALLADNLYYLPWANRVLRPDPAPASCDRVPTVLVHGYMSNRGYFTPMVRMLEAAGLDQVHAPSFRVLFTPIEHFAGELHEAIERVATGCGRPKVNLVCHSMGGLAARHYLREHGAGRVAKLVTIASPHHGTLLAAMGLGLNARQMHRGSRFLAALAASEAAAPPGVDATSVYSPHDNLVSPQDTSRLDWARNVAIPGVGHIAILSCARTFEVLLEELRP
jgi:triacylglycerol esterase/lipase EstA (alpha/beta hydrolase family)